MIATVPPGHEKDFRNERFSPNQKYRFAESQSTHCSKILESTTLIFWSKTESIWKQFLKKNFQICLDAWLLYDSLVPQKHEVPKSYFQATEVTESDPDYVPHVQRDFVETDDLRRDSQHL